MIDALEQAVERFDCGVLSPRSKVFQAATDQRRQRGQIIILSIRVAGCAEPRMRARLGERVASVFASLHRRTQLTPLRRGRTNQRAINRCRTPRLGTVRTWTRCQDLPVSRCEITTRARSSCTEAILANGNTCCFLNSPVYVRFPPGSNTSRAPKATGTPRFNSD